MPKFENHEPFYSTVHSMLEGVAGLTPERREEKLRQLIINYGQQLNGCLIRKYGISEDDAAEVVQQFLLTRLLQPTPELNVAGQFLAAKRVEPQLRFRNYLGRVLYNFHIDQRRRRQLPVVKVDCLEASVGTTPENLDEDLREDITWASSKTMAKRGVRKERKLTITTFHRMRWAARHRMEFTIRNGTSVMSA